MTPSVTISGRGADRLDAGHVWVFRTDVRVAPSVPGGAAVRVLDERGRFLGTALYSARSRIALRLLSRDDRPADQIIEERLRLAIDLRARLFPNAEAVRLVHGEGDWLPGLVVDRYGTALSIQTLTQAMEQRQQWIVQRLLALTGATAVVARNDVATRRSEGLVLVKAVLHGQPPGVLTYREGDIRLTVDLLEGQKTGAYLDQRENHILAGELASGRALDCFAYHGGFALQFARRASSVTAVDASDRAIAELSANAQRNGLTNVSAQVADAFDFLRERADAGERYDTIVLDPPAFAKTRESMEPALRGYKEINLRALKMLAPGGLLVTSTCSYHVDESLFAQVVLGAASDARRQVQILERRGPGRDHPELMGVPETRYLKCFIIRAL